MVPSDDVEEVEILKARFSTFDVEMKATEAKVNVVNELARQLLNSTHPNSDEVVAREKKLNQRWVVETLETQPKVGGRNIRNSTKGGW